MSFEPRIKILSDVASIAEEARQIIVEDYTNHASSNDSDYDNTNNSNDNNTNASKQGSALPFSLALSGGSTPRHLYNLLHEYNLSLFQNKEYGIKSIIGDERLVPADDDLSNYHMAYKALLYDVPPENIYAPNTAIAENSAKDEIRGQRDAETVAQEFETILRSNLPLIDICVDDKEFNNIYESVDNTNKDDQTKQEEANKVASIPQIDIVLLGFGADGHTASIFPNSIAAAEKKSAVSVSFPSPTMQPKVWRVTLTIPVITHAKHVVVLAAGQDKNWVVRGILDPERTENVPVSRFLRQCKGKVTFLLDQTAAEGITVNEAYCSNDCDLHEQQ